MAHVNRVVSLLTDDKCKFTHVRLADCPTSVTVPPFLTKNKAPTTQVHVPQNQLPYVVRCPHPEMPAVDDNPIPGVWTYVYFSAGIFLWRVHRETKVIESVFSDPFSRVISDVHVHEHENTAYYEAIGDIFKHHWPTSTHTTIANPGGGYSCHSLDINRDKRLIVTGFSESSLPDSAYPVIYDFLGNVVKVGTVIEDGTNRPGNMEGASQAGDKMYIHHVTFSTNLVAGNMLLEYDIPGDSWSTLADGYGSGFVSSDRVGAVVAGLPGIQDFHTSADAVTVWNAGFGSFNNITGLTRDISNHRGFRYDPVEDWIYYAGNTGFLNGQGIYRVKPTGLQDELFVAVPDNIYGTIKGLDLGIDYKV